MTRKASIFRPIACGETIPVGNPHAISVSMPKLQDVIDYEEQTPEIRQRITSAYPRFVRHPYIMQLANYIAQKYAVKSEEEVVILSSPQAAEQLLEETNISSALKVQEPFGAISVRRGTKQLTDALLFIQHTGSLLSSRAAQDYLYEKGLLNKRFEEELAPEGEAEASIKATLAKAYRQPVSNIGLAPSGMNAVCAAIKGVQKEQEAKGRNILVQLGWLYSDSMNIVSRYGSRSKQFFDVEKLDHLACFLAEHGKQVSAILTEVPTNPQLKCVDLVLLRSLCNTYDIPLIIDTTIATPYLFDFTPYADIMVESLSKFASGHADLLMGAVVMNQHGKAMPLAKAIFKQLEPVYKGDMQRLAHTIKNYEQRVRRVSENTAALVAHFKSCSYIHRLFYHQFDGAYVGLISVSFRSDFQQIYDALKLPKGPTLGTEFTLAMPYTYLAHYNHTLTESGRKLLESIELPINLLRIAVGTEAIGDIMEEFEQAIRQS